MADASEMPPGAETVLASACLLGLPTRYDGGSRPDADVLALRRRFRVIPVCPEVLGGLPTPRPPAEIESGDGRDVLDGRARVVRCDGVDVTAAYLEGVQRVADEAERAGARAAYLKEKSPACGATTILRKGAVVAGPGVCAALLARKGLRIVGRP